MDFEVIKYTSQVISWCLSKKILSHIEQVMLKWQRSSLRVTTVYVILKEVILCNYMVALKQSSHSHINEVKFLTCVILPISIIT